MIWHIIARENSNDNFIIREPQTGNPVYVDLSGVDRSNGIRNNLSRIFELYGSYPSDVASDLLKFSLAVFSADKLADRNQAFNKWSRYICLYLPVINIDLWNGIKEKIEHTLDFLTGDHWVIQFRMSNENQFLDRKQLQERIPSFSHSPKAFALMSGGLDSFAGAIEVLETTPGEVIFISHYGRGGVTKTVQDRVYSLLGQKYPNHFCSLQFFIQPPEGTAGKTEPTQRSRSFLFLSLAAAVSSASRNNVPLNIYENGLLSLNVPLAANRGGGLSTRTTHPYFLSMFQEILKHLGINMEITTPFRFFTKGEMLNDTKNSTVLKEGLLLTHSCSHSTYVRFHGGSPDDHCGYCLPCIVRRAATSFAGFEDVDYIVDVLKNNLPTDKVEGKDLYGLRIAIERIDNTNSSLYSLVRSAGPLQSSKEEIVQYVEVYRRGMEEIKWFLGKK